jgi:hypothetical protein
MEKRRLNHSAAVFIALLGASILESGADSANTQTLSSTVSRPIFAAEEEFWQRLERTTSIYWTDVPLRDGLLRLAETHGVAIFLDRRCDPGQPVTLTVRQRSLRDVLLEIAHQRGYELAFLGPLVYIGPADTANRLEIVAAQRRKELQALGRIGASALRPAPISWPRLSTPRNLVLQWAREAGWQLANAEEIPHDLWPETSLPALTIADRITLVLLQFNQTYQVSESGVMTVVPFVPLDGEIKRFRIGGETSVLAQRWAQQFPDCVVVASGPEILVQGPVETLSELSRLAASFESLQRPSLGTSPPATAAMDPFAQRRFTVRDGRGTLEGVIRQLAQQLGMEVQFDAEAARRKGVRLDQLIEFRVTNATVDELWRAILEPRGLTFVRTGRTIRIFPASHAGAP